MYKLHFLLNSINCAPFSLSKLETAYFQNTYVHQTVWIILIRITAKRKGNLSSWLLFMCHYWFTHAHWCKRQLCIICTDEALKAILNYGLSEACFRSWYSTWYSMFYFKHCYWNVAVWFCSVHSDHEQIASIHNYVVAQPKHCFRVQCVMKGTILLQLRPVIIQRKAVCSLDLSE